MDDPNDVVAANEKFANINEEDAVSALDGFVVEENNEEIYFVDQSLHCVWYISNDLFEMRMKK